MNPATNRFAKHAVSALLAVVACPLFAFIPAYPTAGRDTAAIRPSDATDAFAHDALGRMTAATNALNKQVFRAWHDGNGNTTNRVDGAGNAVRHAYDALNRLTNSIAIPNSSLLTPNSAGTTNRFASNAVAPLAVAYDSMLIFAREGRYKFFRRNLSVSHHSSSDRFDGGLRRRSSSQCNPGAWGKH